MSAIQLTSAQWRDMVQGNLGRVLAYVQATAILSDDDAVAINQSLSQTASFVQAWAKSSQPAAPVPHEGVKAHETSAAVEPVVKKRRGRPPKPRIEKQALYSE